MEVLPAVKESALGNEHYQNMEFYSTNAVIQLSNTMDTLLDSNEEKPLNMEHIDKAIDCADAIVKIMAMFHKGREIQARSEAVEIISGNN